MPPNLQELDLWEELGDAIDKVWPNLFDNQLKILSSLRDTYVRNPLSEEKPKYIEEDLDSPIPNFPNRFRTREINFASKDYKIDVYKVAPPIPGSNLPQVIRLTPGTTGWTPFDGYTVTIHAPIGVNETIKVVAIQDTIFDVDNFYDYGNSQRVSEFITATSSALTTLDVWSSVDQLTGEPANLSTGYPYNLLVVYAFDPAVNDYVYIPYGDTRVIDGEKIQIQTAAPTDKFRVFVRSPATEVTRKLRQLGFLYSDLEYITRPTYVDNPHITQLMADTFSKFLKETQGTKSFMDYYQFCSNTLIEIKRLWAQDTPGSPDNIVTDDTYGRFIREDDIDFSTNPPIWITGDNNSGWYPTSHVDLVYDLFLFGSNIDFKSIRKFFDYVAPINLVLDKIVLELNPPVEDTATLTIHGAGDFVQIF